MRKIRVSTLTGIQKIWIIIIKTCFKKNEDFYFIWNRWYPFTLKLVLKKPPWSGKSFISLDRVDLRHDNYNDRDFFFFTRYLHFLVS